MSRGVCLTDKEIRSLMREGRISGDITDNQVQAASLDLTIGNEVYVLDTESEGIFRPGKTDTVYRKLLELGERQRYRVSIEDGFEIKKGFTYLFPLRERIKVSKGEYVRSSTKSSFGRLFLNCRMLCDFTPSFDEVIGTAQERELSLWLLVQPLTFNLIVYPGLAFNQLRFFRGLDAQLSPSEILEEWKQNPLLLERGAGGAMVPSDPVVTDGLLIHLDLQGSSSARGVVGLRARHNPNPIDLRKIGEYKTDYYFEPILRDERPIKLIRGEHYLFASKEVLKIPAHLSTEVKAYSHVGVVGPLHFAGFIDSGFSGDLVFEVRSDEVTPMVLSDGMPISKLDVFRNEIPEKLYGASSNYQGQMGPRPSKYFRRDS